MYKQTRGINDASYMNQQTVVQTRPLRYMTEAVRGDRGYKFAHPESIDDNTLLRMQPTRLNSLDRDQCELFGTAPLKLGRVANDVDTESALRFSDHQRTNAVEKVLTERSFQFVDDVHVSAFTNTVDNEVRSRSTRVDQRNQRAQNMNC
jgi:hypothetical protein